MTDGDIVVTAQRRSESILKVPISMATMSQDDLKTRGITNAISLAGQVPSLQVNSPYGDSMPNFTLRGIGVGNEHNFNQASPIGVYTDDAYISARAIQGIGMFDLERIEVLAGPQGTLYGRNTTGGAINFISRKPSLSGSNGYVDVGYARFNTFTADGAVETTLSEGKAGLRVSFNYARGDGYIKNRALDEPAASSTNMVAGRAILRLMPSEKLDITIKGSIGRSDPTQAGIFNQGTGANGASPLQGTGRAAKGLSFFETDSPRLGRSYVYTYGGQVNIKYQLSDAVSLFSLTSYDYADQNFTQEGTGLESATVFTQLLDTSYGNRFKMFNQELRASYASDDTKLQVGGYYGSDKINSDSYYWLVNGASNIHQLYDQTRRSSAIFAQGDQKMGHINVTLGLRYTWDKLKYDNYASYLGPAALNNGTRDTSIFPLDKSPLYFLGSYDAASGGYKSGPPVVLTSFGRVRRLTERAAINYVFDGGQILYASYSRGYRGASLCGQCFTGPITQTEPEKVNAYEIGAKGKFLDNMLSVSVAAFLMKYRNQQINEVNGANTILENVNSAEIKGFEFDFTLRPTSTLRLSMNGSVLDPKYKDGKLLFGDISGFQMAYAPKFQMSGQIDWQFAKAGEGTFSFSPSVVYTSKVYYSPYEDTNNQQFLHQDRFAKVNAQLSYETPRYSVRAWMKNVFNAKTFADGLDLTGAFGYVYLIQSPPRTFGASVGYRF
ncbi:MAG: TonB-dependent receptor [Pseudomonadota bacterium]